MRNKRRETVTKEKAKKKDIFVEYRITVKIMVSINK